jgi:hypothetical protein
MPRSGSKGRYGTFSTSPACACDPHVTCGSCLDRALERQRAEARVPPPRTKGERP